MKQLYNTFASVLIIAGIISTACKKEKSCKGCINDNKAPVAIAGTDQQITLPTDSITLDGSSSNDPDGTISTWLWKKISGPASGNIVNERMVRTTVRNLDAGVYRFELTVNDNGGLMTKDTMQVIVSKADQVNRPPISVAGTDQQITLPAHSVNLDGSGSSDPDNNISSYQWKKIEGPSSYTITNANTAATQVHNLVEGVYRFELKVTDAGGLFAKDTMQVTVVPSTITGSNNIYIAGWGINTSGKMVARIRTNNLLQDLSDGQYDAVANSVFVTNNNVYVAGSEINASGKRVAKLWKNGVEQTLSNGQYYAGASSVFVSGTDVYVAGWEVNARNKSVAKLWKNGVGQNLSDGQNDGAATSVFVSGADVYVAGWYMDYNGTCVWKNGIAQVIANGNSPDGGQSLFVSGNDVYVAMGWLSHTGGAYYAGLWKNGQLEFDASGLATSVFVSGSDVYVAGQRDWGGSNYEATIWKNGMPQKIGDVGEITNSIFVSGSDVYAAGNNIYFTGTASLWKNGIGYSIPGLNAANSVFVK